MLGQFVNRCKDSVSQDAAKKYGAVLALTGLGIGVSALADSGVMRKERTEDYDKLCAIAKEVFRRKVGRNQPRGSSWP